jgi:hypothetical protein
MYSDFDFERSEQRARIGAGLTTETADFPGRPQRVSASLTLYLYLPWRSRGEATTRMSSGSESGY